MLGTDLSATALYLSCTTFAIKIKVGQLDDVGSDHFDTEVLEDDMREEDITELMTVDDEGHEILILSLTVIFGQTRRSTYRSHHVLQHLA